MNNRGNIDEMILQGRKRLRNSGNSPHSVLHTISEQCIFRQKTKRENGQVSDRLSREEKMMRVFWRIMMRRYGFCFQLLKLKYLFPDQTMSQNISLDSHDWLLIREEPLHTLVKIYETKELQAKIWAFINLKTLKLKEKMQKFSTTLQEAQDRMDSLHKSDTFSRIKAYSFKFPHSPPTTKPKILTIQSKNQLRENKISTQTTVYEKTPSKSPNVIRIKTSPPRVTRVELSPSRARVVYPKTESIEKTETRREVSGVRILGGKSPDQESASTQPYKYQTSPGGCIHIHGCCTINHTCHQRCHPCHHACHGCVLPQSPNSCMWQVNRSYRSTHESINDLSTYNMQQRLEYLMKLEALYELNQQSRK